MKIFKEFSLLFISAIGFLVFDTAKCSDAAEDLSHHKNIGLLKETCGHSEHNGASIVRPFEFRWLALIKYEGEKKFPFSCQGALISDRYVLTSAHCLTHLNSALKPISVRLGEFDLKSEKDCLEPNEPTGLRCAPTPLDIDIEEIRIHPNFTNEKPRSVVHDIGLLRLARPVVSEYVQPICLPVEEEPKTFDEKLNLVGWSRHYDNLSIPEKLQVPVIGYDQCAAAVKKNVVTSAENNICVGGRNDRNPFCPISGSTLSYYVKKDNGQGRYVMVATGSVGHPSCNTDVIPEVFTRVGVHMKWILDSMKP